MRIPIPALKVREIFEAQTKLLVRPADHAFKPNLRWHDEPVAWGQVARDMEATVAGGAGVSSSSTCYPELYAVCVRGCADSRVRFQHERISFDEDLIAALNVGVGRFQIEDEIGGGVGAGGEDCGIVAAFRVDA